VPARTGSDVLGVVALYASDNHQQYHDQRALAALRPASHLLGGLVERWTRHDTHAKLTKRELELLVLASNGATSPQIARQLLISPWTVKTHFENIRAKLAVPDRAAAVALAIRAGMIA
jgi:DNA-binding CsgD family transcriptional regulator